MKMLIADDDVSIVDMVENVYSWSFLGIDQVLRAYNGIVAMELIQKERPGIVLCDISMPQMDGIQVLRQVRQEGIETEFIILTAHADFEYAREALRYGAVNYLTKPFSPEELITAVEKAASKLKFFRASSEKQRRQRVNSLLGELCKGTYGGQRDQVESRIAAWNCGLHGEDRFFMVYVSVDQGEIARLAEWPVESFHYAFRQLALEVIAQRLTFEQSLDHYRDNRYTVQLFLEAGLFLKDEVVKRCGTFQQLCGEYLGGIPVCLIGPVFSLYRAAWMGEKMEQSLWKNRLQKGKTVVVDFSQEQEEGPVFSLSLDEIKKALLQKNKAVLLEKVAQQLDVILANSRGDSQFHQFHQDLLQMFYVFLQQHNVDAHSLFEDSSLQVLEEKAERSPMDMLRFVEAMYDALDGISNYSTLPSSLVERVKEYIEEHFQENIGRESIAKAIFITPNYLSKIFAAETGNTLREYINTRRVREAQWLLSQTSKTISEIALEVGFENIPYFSTVFKKNCGITPVEWRNGR